MFQLGPFSSYMKMYLKERQRKGILTDQAKISLETDSDSGHIKEESKSHSFHHNPENGDVSRECIHRIQVFAESRRSEFQIAPDVYFPSESLLVNHPQQFIFDFTNKSNCVDFLSIKYSSHG